MNRHLGNFTISIPMIEKEPQRVMDVMSRCIILRAEMMYISNSIHYTASSDLFDAVSVGEAAPEYELRISTSGWQFVKKGEGF